MAAACGAAFLWGTGALVVNLLIARFGLNPEGISFWRFVVGAVFLIALFARPAVWPRLRGELCCATVAWRRCCWASPCRPRNGRARC